jgi:hypothetical protein
MTPQHSFGWKDDALGGEGRNVAQRRETRNACSSSIVLSRRKLTNSSSTLVSIAGLLELSDRATVRTATISFTSLSDVPRGRSQVRAQLRPLKKPHPTLSARPFRARRSNV